MNVDIRELGMRVAALTAGVWVTEKANLLRNFEDIEPGKAALKGAALLTISQYVGQMGLSYVTTMQRAPASLLEDVTGTALDMLTNAVVLYAMDKLQVDELIVRRGVSDEMHAVHLAVLFAICQEVSRLFLRDWVHRTFGTTNGTTVHRQFRR